MRQIDRICSDINRRIQHMDFQEESAIREYLEMQIVDDKLLLFMSDVREIAYILDVNNECIHDLLTDAGYEL